MCRRLFPFLLFLWASSILLAQSMHDFSGVYLRNPPKSSTRVVSKTQAERIRFWQELDQVLGTGSPLILQATQTADSIVVTRIQNNARATSYYYFNGLEFKKAQSAGYKGLGRAKLKGNTLLTEADVPLPWSTRMTKTFKEKWVLSADSRILTIQPLPFGRAETYTRQASRDAALARTSEASLMNKCVCLRWPSPLNDLSKREGEAELGFTAYRELNTCVLFDAGLWGEFFNGLERNDTPNGTQF